MSLYAGANIQYYRIVNLKDRRLEVYRSPIKDNSGFYGSSYAEIRIFMEMDEVSRLAMPDAKIKVADILP